MRRKRNDRICKKCLIHYNQEWRKKNPDRYQQLQGKCHICQTELTDKNWYLSCRKKYDRICKKCKMQQTRDWQKKNPDKLSVHQKRHYENHKDEILEQHKQYKDQYLQTPEGKEILRKILKQYSQSPRGKEIIRKIQNRRNRDYGHNPLNNPFPNCHRHHLHIENKDDFVYTPDRLHESIRHRPSNPKSMYRINLWVLFWLMYG